MQQCLEIDVRCRRCEQWTRLAVIPAKLKGFDVTTILGKAAQCPCGQQITADTGNTRTTPVVQGLDDAGPGGT